MRLYDISSQRSRIMLFDFWETAIKAITGDLDGYTLYLGNGSGCLASVEIRTGWELHQHLQLVSCISHCLTCILIQMIEILVPKFMIFFGSMYYRFHCAQIIKASICKGMVLKICSMGFGPFFMRGIGLW